MADIKVTDGDFFEVKFKLKFKQAEVNRLPAKKFTKFIVESHLRDQAAALITPAFKEVAVTQDDQAIEMIFQAGPFPDPPKNPPTMLVKLFGHYEGPDGKDNQEFPLGDVTIANPAGK